jgi:NAD(P)-dependent dehydrogenase (short-subunit alcohol dehydrogenase family)
MRDFKDKVAVITGGASGIGFGLAERCSEEGMKVVVADVEKSALENAAERLKNRCASLLTVCIDVSRPPEIELLAKKTLDKFGAVHLLFNNAGVQANRSINHPVWENTLADWQWLISVNLMGPVNGINTFLPIMLKQDTECYIVNTSSMAGLIADPQLVIYSATKAAVIKLSEGLYLQLKNLNSKIGVSVYCPAFVTSQLGKAERNRPPDMYNPGDTTDASEPTLVKSGKAAFITLTPQQSADLVFKAISQGTFYIFSDPLVTRLFKQRSDNILAGLNPQKPDFGF